MKREHYGTLRRWWKKYPDPKLFPPQGLGYLIAGTSEGHPIFHGKPVRTSWVIKHNEKTGSVMTMHARYKLGTPKYTDNPKDAV